MQVDWLTTAAQFVNFFVLVWLLRRFLFRPVADAIEARRAEVAKAFAEAEKREGEAAAEREALADERAALAASVQDRLTAAEAVAAARKVELDGEAEEAANRARAELEEALKEERHAFRTALRAEAGRAGIEIARRVLEDLADEALEAQLIRRLGRELAQETDDASAVAGEPVAATLTCRWPHHELEPELKERLTEHLRRLLGAPVTLEIRHDETSPVGAVLDAPGLHAAWTLDGHLDRIAERHDAGMTASDHAGADAPAGSMAAR
ncbi:MAG: hypothetical protein AAF371_06665 [Pseudomonadota bacterium]